MPMTEEEESLRNVMWDSIGMLVDLGIVPGENASAVLSIMYTQAAQKFRGLLTASSEASATVERTREALVTQGLAYMALKKQGMPTKLKKAVTTVFRVMEFLEPGDVDNALGTLDCSQADLDAAMKRVREAVSL